jgi:hypothetical protein
MTFSLASAHSTASGRIFSNCSGKICIIAHFYHLEISKPQEVGGTGASVTLIRFQFNDDFAEVPHSLHEIHPNYLNNGHLRLPQ